MHLPLSFFSLLSIASFTIAHEHARAVTLSSAASTPTIVQNSGSFIYVDCYTEATAGRALTGKSVASDDMNIEYCAGNCTAFTYFGVEYSRECYCGNSLAAGSVPATDGRCKMTCMGNSTEYCGGSNGLQFYSKISVSSSVASKTASIASSSAVTSSVIPTGTGIVSKVGTYDFQGCYIEATNGRALSGKTYYNDSLTIESCAAQCSGFLWFGAEYGRECYCGNTLSAGSVLTALSDCDMACPGNSAEFCGAGNRLQMYKNSASSVSSSATATTATVSATPSGIVKSVSSFTFQGCYTEATNGRALTGKTYYNDSLTIELCAAQCSRFTWFGAEYGRECYCGNVPNAGSVLTSLSDCKMLCPGNSGEICGDGNRLQMYKNTGASSTSATVTSSTSSANSTAISTISSSSTSASPIATASSYWLEQIKHQGISAFNPASDYVVFRNVKDYGAKGDGITDDTAAINLAISSGNRCAPNACTGSTITPALVYIPPGTYKISSSIVLYYYTQLVGNPNSLPILKATSVFSGFGLIDGDQYGTFGLGFGATNVFWRQVRNLVLDTTGIPAETSSTGIHWPTAQATSLQNIVFKMSDAPGTQHQGIFIEDGSGGFMNDLVFYGGLQGVVFGNQQFTVRNITFYNAVTAINQLWDWGWTYKSISINNCSVGLDMSGGGRTAQAVGSVTFIDSTISNTGVGIVMAHDFSSLPATAGSLIIENTQLSNVSTAIQGPNSTVALAGATGTTTIAGWAQGHVYSPTGPNNFQGSITPFTRSASLLNDGKFYERSKPQYATNSLSDFMSVRTQGAVGNGVADDTMVLQSAINSAAASGKIVFFDAGTYKITNTLYIPAGSRIVGESYSVIMGSGAYFSNINAPKPVVRVGKSGETGVVEWTDMIVSTQGATAGAIVIEWNLKSSSTSPSGMWDVHVRIGGFAGSQLQVAQCVKTTSNSTVNTNCIAAYMSMHVTRSAGGLYMENVWLWTADHDVEDASNTQITIYSGRGLYVDSGADTLWLLGTSSEHHTLYQYQFSQAKNVFMGQIQTETAYYQPNPPATLPFTVNTTIHDPDFSNCGSANCASGWGLRVINGQNILVYGAGLYSFFNNYNTSCSATTSTVDCQSHIFSVEGAHSYNIGVYNLNTIGSTSMVDHDGVSLAKKVDNLSSFQDTIAVFRTG